MKKKIIAGAAAVLVAASAAITAFAAGESVASFWVSGSTVICDLTYYENKGIWPWDQEWVNAYTKAGSTMSSMKSKATLLYKDGTKDRTVSDSKTEYGVTTVSIKVSEHTGGTGKMGEGYHFAGVSYYSDSETTVVYW